MSMMVTTAQLYWYANVAKILLGLKIVTQFVVQIHVLRYQEEVESEEMEPVLDAMTTRSLSMDNVRDKFVELMHI
jgi:hypothetical protein